MYVGGACGFEDDVGQPPYSAMISAGNANIFRAGHGCGRCYQVPTWIYRVPLYIIFFSSL